ncbi:uncharacterized protein LOC113555031 [Rhopalosiphum maidis]|uniref:uncharacterized protein LOC113555031 n=1 Tax=Rhopalosiphum maidis TaxID=43146 RepID=UPI000EFED58C|nr:uncharacterized protein LOC113555031 [Rhopalosiphum maidis]XP_026815114.1 uncharacterized protein LOC113555031 [Rhopalosiphum maidis]
MISYLRLIKISSLPVDAKLQVKMFMNQLTVFDMDKITAFGIFNVNLNLVMSKRKMISYLRLIRISSLAVETKLQVKMFMNQLTVFDMDGISAFGIFNINLNLVMAIIILLITGLTTLLQMKNNSNMIQYMNNTLVFYENISKPS